MKLKRLVIPHKLIAMLAEPDPLDNEYDAIEYQLLHEFFPSAKEQYLRKVAEATKEYRATVLRRKDWVEGLTSRKYRFYLPRKVVRIPDELMELGR